MIAVLQGDYQGLLCNWRERPLQDFRSLMQIPCSYDYALALSRQV